MNSASTLIGTTINGGTGYCKNLLDSVNSFISIQASIQDANSTIQTNMDHNSSEYSDKIKSLRAKAYGGCAACVIFPPACIAC